MAPVVVSSELLLFMLATAAAGGALLAFAVAGPPAWLTRRWSLAPAQQEEEEEQRQQQTATKRARHVEEAAEEEPLAPLQQGARRQGVLQLAQSRRLDTADVPSTPLSPFGGLTHFPSDDSTSTLGAVGGNPYLPASRRESTAVAGMAGRMPSRGQASGSAPNDDGAGDSGDAEPPTQGEQQMVDAFLRRWKDSSMSRPWSTTSDSEGTPGVATTQQQVQEQQQLGGARSKSGSLESNLGLQLPIMGHVSQRSGGSTGSAGKSSGSDHHSATDITLLPDGFNLVDFSELELWRQLGEGSFGQVWLAKYCQTNVAAKVLTLRGIPTSEAHSTQLRQLIKEASIMSKLRHPNVCQYLGACLDPPCIIMEYCARKSLDALLAQAAVDEHIAHQLPWARLLSMACDAAKGMLYLHSRSPPVAHRDLKSANLLVDGQWHVKVADFNLSRPMEAGVAVSTLCVTNPRWLAPCILSGEHGGLAADVWAFGTVLWEIMTWKVPFEGLNPFQIISRVQSTGDSCLDIPPPDQLPAGQLSGYQEYVDIMQACWARNPADRPMMDEVATRLRGLLVSELHLHTSSRGSLDRTLTSRRSSKFSVLVGAPSGLAAAPSGLAAAPEVPALAGASASDGAPQQPAAVPARAVSTSGGAAQPPAALAAPTATPGDLQHPPPAPASTDAGSGGVAQAPVAPAPAGVAASHDATQPPGTPAPVHAAADE